MNADTLVVDLADIGENPAEAPYNCWIEIDREERKAVITWVENLQFHAECIGPDHPGWWYDGWLTPAAEDALAKRLAELIAQQGKVSTPVFSVHYCGEEPNVAFEVVTDYRDGETYEQWLDRIGWPVVATLINVTDPGTFNSAYLFDMKEVDA